MKPLHCDQMKNLLKSFSTQLEYISYQLKLKKMHIYMEYNTNSIFFNLVLSESQLLLRIKLCQ